MNTKGWIAVFWFGICGFLILMIRFDSMSREGFRVPRGQTGTEEHGRGKQKIAKGKGREEEALWNE